MISQIKKISKERESLIEQIRRELKQTYWYLVKIRELRKQHGLLTTDHNTERRLSSLKRAIRNGLIDRERDYNTKLQAELHAYSERNTSLCEEIGRLQKHGTHHNGDGT